VKSLAAILAASAGLTMASMASAQCVSVDPVVVPQVRIDPLDAAGPGEVVQPFVLSFRRAGAGSEPLAVRYQVVDEDSTIVSRVGLTQGPTVEWSSSDTSHDIGAFRSDAYTLLRTGSAVLGENDTVAQRQVAMRVTDLRADLAAGVYREQFTVRYWCGDIDQGLPFESTGIVSVSVAVPNVLSANIAGASTRGEIDFADFAQLSRRLVVSVRSTGPYRVAARSLNGGVMLREGGNSEQVSDRIGYRASFDGHLLDLAATSGQSADRAGLVGRMIPLEIEVDSIERNRAGSYFDTLFITLSPAN